MCRGCRNRGRGPRPRLACGDAVYRCFSYPLRVLRLPPEGLPGPGNPGPRPPPLLYAQGPLTCYSYPHSCFDYPATCGGCREPRRGAAHPAALYRMPYGTCYSTEPGAYMPFTCYSYPAECRRGANKVPCGRRGAACGKCRIPVQLPDHVRQLPGDAPWSVPTRCRAAGTCAECRGHCSVTESPAASGGPVCSLGVPCAYDVLRISG